MWIYQEIIAEIQPDLIIETGTHIGGSALFMAHMLDIVGHGENYYDRYPRSCW
jgi:cephalosporin hydroxylase